MAVAVLIAGVRFVPLQSLSKHPVGHALVDVEGILAVAERLQGRHLKSFWFHSGHTLHHLLCGVHVDLHMKKLSCCRAETEWRTKVHAKGTCASFGICGHRKDGDVLNCANNTVAQPISSSVAQKLQVKHPHCVSRQAYSVLMKQICSAIILGN